MNYLQNKKQIMMAILINLSVISSISHVNASNCCFPKGKELFLDATSIPSWNNDYVYPYVYMFGNDGWNTWIKLRKQYCNSKYFTFRIPQGGYYGMVFSCNNCDVGSFEKCNQQTVDIYCDNNNNCYKFNGKYSEGKIIGNWHYLHENYFPAGQPIFLNVTNTLNWCNPYMYLFGQDCVDAWVKMEKHITDDGNEYFSGIVPKGNYYGLGFTSQDGDICNFNNCNAQTIDILWDNQSNCYTFNGKDNDGRITGNWSTVDLQLDIDKKLIEGKYKINIDSIYSPYIEINNDGKIEYTADDGDLVNIKSKVINNTSLIEIKSDDVDLNKNDKNYYTFTMPDSDVTITAKYLFNKRKAFTGDIFWVDTQPSIDDSPIGLVKWTNRTGGGCRTNDYYTLYLPSGIDICNLPVYFGIGDSFTINDKTIQQGQKYSFNLNEMYTINNYKLKIMQGSSTSIYINTNEDLPIGIVSENYIPDKIYNHKHSIVRVNCQFMSVNENGKIVNEPQILTKIRGRGDGSWSVGYQRFGKYPYNITLQNDTDILKMGANNSKHFCLLANAVDESLLRVLEVYKAATDANIPFTPHCVISDFYNNGEYLGSYSVIENIGIGNNELINDGETVSKYHNDKNATGKNIRDKYTFNNKQYDFQYTDIGQIDDGIDFKKKAYLLGHESIRKAQAEDCWFLSPCGQYVQIRYPKRLNKEEMEFIISKYAEAEAAVYSNNTYKMKELMDLNSFALVYCLNEFTKQMEAGCTGYYIYYNGEYENPKLLAAPVWDYDWSLGMYRHWSRNYVDLKKNPNETNNDNDNSEGWYVRYRLFNTDENNSTKYNKNKLNLPAKMCENGNFWNYYVKNAWKQMKPVLDKVFGNKGTIDNDFNENKKSFEMNEARYGFLKTHPGYSCGSAITGSTPEEAYLYLKNFANARIKWLDDRLKK